jgi:glyoxylase-like metal-dependent hydrolase (beta-lactamase superfamily II)
MRNVAERVIVAAVALLVLTPPAKAQAQDLFELVKVSEGVYAAIARKTYPLNSNAAVVINGDDVLIVDSHATPSSARSLISMVRKLTSNPVRYVVNTHFHYDHARGNEAYLLPYPHEAIIISTGATRDNLASIETARLKADLAEMPARIARLKSEMAGQTDPARGQQLADAERYHEELKRMKIVLPTLTFDKSLVIHKPGRDIFILFLGRGHTSGDAVVYLPKERVIVTGDLLTSWGPGLGDGYPNEWIQTLDELAKLDFEHVIGGHGAVSNRQIIAALRNYLTDLIAAVKVEVKKGSSLEATRKTVLERLVPKYESRFAPGEFANRAPGNVAKVYEDVKANRY